MKKLITHLVAALLMVTCVAPLVADDDTPSIIPPGYTVQTIPNPPGVEFGVAGLDVAADGDVYASTRYGDVWRLHDGKWSLFADGLQESTGLMVDRKTGEIFVTQKPELTQLIDTDHDGVADVYKAISNAWGFTGNYHEFCFGPVRDSHGNFYGTLNLAHGSGEKVLGSVMSIDSPYRGTCFKVTPDGTFSVFAWGMRSPCGLTINHENDEIFYTDNQGDWNASSTLQHVVEGRFHGHPCSLKYHPDFVSRDLNKIPISEYDKLRTPPAIWIPHAIIANSPGNPIIDTTAGKFGPFAGQFFVGDQTRANVFRCWLEKVDGFYQGCVINFIDHTQCGIVRCAFAPDGSLWLGQTSRGWGTVGKKPYGVQRIVYDGKTTPFEMHHVELTKTGFDVVFTQPVAKEAVKPEAFAVEHWHYEYHPAYGCDRLDLTKVTPTSATLSDDGKTVHITLPELLENKVYHIHPNIPAADGSKMTSPDAYYTLNHLK
ncbi:MAG: hypothetical protein GC162_10545 [Planctomycetes bacterium]|nr:hypothetical protein [Planctomycetota bacterium]